MDVAIQAYQHLFVPLYKLVGKPPQSRPFSNIISYTHFMVTPRELEDHFCPAHCIITSAFRQLLPSRPIGSKVHSCSQLTLFKEYGRSHYAYNQALPPQRFHSSKCLAP